MTWAYPAIMLAAVASAAILSRGRQHSLGLSSSDRLAIGLGAFIGAMLGAKLPFVLFAEEGIFSLTWFDNGKTILFGLVGGYLGVEIAKWANGIHVKTGDSFAVPVAVAVAIGRLSCVVAGCCYGKPTNLPWGVDFGDGVRRHPTQIYESLFHLACAILLEQLQRRGLLKGQLIKLYILLYLGYRFLTEFLRPEPIVGLGLTFYQWSCLAIAPIFVVLWIRDARSPAISGTVARAEIGVNPPSVPG